MTVQCRSLSHRRRIGGSYADKVLDTGPIAYWPLDDTAGTVARCLVDPAQNGTSTGVTWAADNTGPFNTPAPSFDGINDRINIYSAAFDAVFNGPEGTTMIWVKVAGTGVWTDAQSRFPLFIYDDAQNNTYINKGLANNTVVGRVEAGSGAGAITANPYTNVEWFVAHVTWSDANNDDEVKLFLDAVQQGAPSAGLNAWGGGGLDATRTVIGASTTGGASPHHGYLAQCVVWPRVLPQATITALANP